MALINKIDNFASITFGGSPINSNTVSTVLLLAPTIVKAVDKVVASIGDTLTYTITITNIAIGPITNLPFSDVIPTGSTYITDSFSVAGTSVTPTISSNTISYTIPSIAAAGSVNVVFKVKIVGGSI